MVYNIEMQPRLETPSVDPMRPFSLGDAVVYVGLGPGKIVGLTERSVAGKLCIYFEIELSKGATRLMVPVEKGHQMLRPVIDSLEVPKIFAALHENLEMPNLWPQRQRIIQRLLEEAELLKAASLFGTLWRRDQQRTLSDSERRLMEQALTLLVGEMALVLNSSPTEVEDQIHRHLGLIIT